MVREYQMQIVRVIVTVITLVPLAQKKESARLCGHSFVPWTRQLKAGVPGRDVLYETQLAHLRRPDRHRHCRRSARTAAQNRYIVRTTGGLGSVLNLCGLLGCQVQGSLDGNINQTFLVTVFDQHCRQSAELRP